ncbi:MAG: adenosylcobinamide-phosphate synthase CbiB [Myxococcales bacterium]|nr:adenosylcobinamide-phosphate synthase CbiB [Myxococcales bacterium]
MLLAPDSHVAPSALALMLAFGIDQLWGEVPARVHPVVWMGHVATMLRRRVPQSSPATALAGGALVALALPALFGAAAFGLLRALPEGPLGAVCEALLLSTTFAVRALGQAVLAVRDALEAQDLQAARRALGQLCSRKTEQLDASQCSAAAIESAAENASDSFVAPMCFYVLFGLPGAMAYRAINTLDAMLGYRGPLEYLGKASARLDDVANLVPARLTAGLMLIAGAGGAMPAVRVWWRDARATASPNAGHPMAMMAGLLGVRLDKKGAYALGAHLRQPGAPDVTRAWKIVSTTAWLSVGAALTGLAGLTALARFTGPSQLGTF